MPNYRFDFGRRIPQSIVEQLAFQSTKELRYFLNNNGVDVSNWGKGEAKSIDDLWRELRCGVSVFRKKEGVLVRELNNVNIRVFNHDKTLYLKESRQIFDDARVRKREANYSLAEKLLPEEAFVCGAIRALKEELGIESVPSLMLINHNENKVNSQSYPGLTTLYKNHVFELFLPKQDFDAGGYQEDKEGITTCFEWVPVQKT